MACGLSGVADDHRMLHWAAAELRRTLTRMLEMDAEDGCFLVVWQNHCCFMLKSSSLSETFAKLKLVRKKRRRKPSLSVKSSVQR